MGTSKSSAGSPSKVPMVPPWVPDVEGDDKSKEPSVTGDAVEDPSLSATVPIAPQGRFNSTRRSLGKFVKSGSEGSLKKGVGRYFKNGLGGAGTATKRFGGTAANAGALYSALGDRDSRGDDSPIDKALSEGKTGKQVIDAVIESVCPINGSQDTESARNAMNDAFSELLSKYPQADLADLSESERNFVIVNYVSIDVYRRFILDVGDKFRKNAVSPAVAVSRMKQAKEYIKETIAASFKSLAKGSTKVAGKGISKIVRIALRNAFLVFAEYAE